MGAYLNNPPVATTSTFINPIMSGDGVTTIMTVPHGLGAKPSWFNVVAASPAAGNISYQISDASNIYIYYNVAPIAGTNNLVYNISYRP